MANPSIQLLKDTVRSSLFKITATNLTGNQTYPNIIEAKKLYGALNTVHGLLYPNGSSSAPVGTELPFYNLNFHRFWYDITSSEGKLEILWTGNGTDVDDFTIMNVTWSGEYNTEGNWTTIPNYNAYKTNVKGNITINTYNVTSFTILFELVKDHLHYNSGEIENPSAFNYGIYGVTP